MSMDITPPHLRCGMGSCPSVHVLEDGRLAIVANLAGETDNVPVEVWAKRNSDAGEALVVVNADLLSDLPELVHLRSQVASLREALGCQADDGVTGTVSSPSALQKSAGEDADRRIEREIMAKVNDLRKAALADYRVYVAELPRRMDRLQAERKAYLHGRLMGLSATYREFEKRQPINWAHFQETERPDEERASAMSAHSGEAGGLTPHLEPQESTQDG